MNSRTIKRPYLVIVLFIFCAYGEAQTSSQNKVDSLKNLLPGSDIHKQVDILNELALIYAPVNFDSSITFSVQAQRIGSVYGYPQGVGLARLYTGNAYYYKMDFKNALISYLSALKFLEENNAWKALGDTYLQLGHINFFIRRGDKAFLYYRQALGYYSKAADESSSANVYEALSLAMDNLNYEPRDSALIYAHKLLNYARNVHDHYREAFALMVIGQIYLDDKKSVSQKQKALAYCDSVLILATEFKYDDLIMVININLGGYYDKSSSFSEITSNLALSRSFYEKAYMAARKVGSSYSKAMILNYLAEISIEEKDYNNAEINLDESEQGLNDFFQFEWKRNNTVGVVNSFTKIIEYFLAQREKNAMYKARFKLAMGRGDFRKSVEYLQLYYQSRDSMNAAQQGQQFELLMAEAEAEKTDQKIRTLAQENELNQMKLARSRFMFAGIGAGVVIISLFLLLFFQRKKLKAEQKSIAMEQRLLRAQMNPHFLFNSLASIQNYIINENTDQASIYLSRFSQLVRNILDNSVEEYVPLEKEIETVENYLELQKVRYTGKFDYRIDIDLDIDTEIVQIPPMLAQPFIENSIEHGIKYRETMGHIDVRFLLEDSLIRFEVEDDGVGRDKAREIETKQGIRHRSMATSITNDRLMSINKKLKRKIRMEIIDLKDSSGKGCGTRVTFGIPVVVK